MDAIRYMRIPRDRRDYASRDDLLNRIRAEFEEMPSLRLTPAQARRLFGLRCDICDRVLRTLVRGQTLRCGVDHRYRLQDDDGQQGQGPVARGRPH